MGALLAQQLVAAGEHVVDAPPKLSSSVRLFERGRIDKIELNDARSATIVAWHNPNLNVVAGLHGRVPNLGTPQDYFTSASNPAAHPHQLNQ